MLGRMTARRRFTVRRTIPPGSPLAGLFAARLRLEASVVDAVAASAGVVPMLVPDA
jgi:hypothetical protein